MITEVAISVPAWGWTAWLTSAVLWDLGVRIRPVGWILNELRPFALPFLLAGYLIPPIFEGQPLTRGDGFWLVFGLVVWLYSRNIGKDDDDRWKRRRRRAAEKIENISGRLVVVPAGAR